MGSIAAAAYSIGAVIASAVATAAVAVAAAVSAIMSAIAAAAAAIGTAVAAAASYVATTVAYVATQVATAVSYAASTIYSAASYAASSIASWASTLYSGIQAFANAIHLKLLINLHNIAYILSSDYRDMMNRLYGKLAQASDALGMGAQDLALMLRNARAVVLSSSQLMGRSYDLADITWMKSMQDFLRKFQRRTDAYRRDPSLLYNDLDRWLIKDSVDAAAQTQRTWMKSIEQTAGVVDETVQDVNELRTSLTNFARSLPGRIREEIMPEINKVNSKVDFFLEKRYYPWKNKTDQVLAVLEDRQAAHTGRMDDIVDRLRYPGDLLQQMDKLPEDKRWEQAQKIQDSANTVAEEESEALQEEALDLHKELQRIARALTAPTEAPEILRKEPERPSPPVGRQEQGPDTWFVGEY